MNLVDKILKEADDVMDKHIKNPETGRSIKVSSALGYEDSHPVKKAALRLLKKAGVQQEVPITKASPKQEPKSNERSHKPKSNKVGISKECVTVIASKGFKGLNAYPQSYVRPDQLEFNPAATGVNKDKVWAVKFPQNLPNGTTVTKTAYTAGFMKKAQVNKYRKISKIKSSDITSLEEKTAKLLAAKSKEVSDSAAVIGIILKTALRIGSADEADSGNVGIRTLKASNVKVQGHKVTLDFIGKSYQQNVAHFEDAHLATYLQKIIKTKKPTDRVFDCSYGTVMKFMDKINPKGINPKDIRTYRATEYAKTLLEDKTIGPPPPLPKEQKDIKKAVKSKLANVFINVAKYLNNTPGMAKNSYVHPVVITDYLHNLGLQPKEVGYKHVTLEGHMLDMDNAQYITEPKTSAITEAEEDISSSFTSMDEMFENNTEYEYGDDVEGLSEEDLDECEEYPLPDWWDNDSIDLVPINQ